MITLSLLVSMKKIWFPLLIITIVSCSEMDKPRLVFDEPVKGRTINLSSKIGESFEVLRNNDTISYSLSFDKVTKYNYLVRSDTDTVFIGTVTKRNELFLLNRPLQNGKFAIHALKFTDSTITGLETESYQSYILNQEIINNNSKELITDTTNTTTINVDKREGKSLFRMVIENLEPEKRITNNYTIKEVENHILEEEKEAHSIEKIKLVKKVFPNPFIDNITVELMETSSYLFKIMDANGKHIKSYKENNNSVNISLLNLLPGVYMLYVTSFKTGDQEVIRIIKKN